jgi:hypothetical protein
MDSSSSEEPNVPIFCRGSTSSRLLPKVGIFFLNCTSGLQKPPYTLKYSLTTSNTLVTNSDTPNNLKYPLTTSHTPVKLQIPPNNLKYPLTTSNTP